MKNTSIQFLKETINSQGGRFGSFSDNFYRFIREEIGITHLQELPAKPSFEERLEKVELMIERAEFDDDKLQQDETSLVQYSDEAVELKSILKKIGPQKDICNKKYLTRFFETFYLKKAGIECLDPHIEHFTNLQVLNLSFNKLETVEHLPPNLKELHLAANSITSIRPTRICESLIHIGLSYNKLGSDQISTICANFPNLFSIDLAFNQVCCLEAVTSNMKELKEIKMINLKGNPVVLAKNYRAIMK